MCVNILGEWPSPGTDTGIPLQMSNPERAEPDELRSLLFFFELRSPCCTETSLHEIPSNAP